MLALLALCLSAYAGPPVDPASAEGLLELGRAAQKAGQTADAKQRYTDCLAIDPDQPACHWELGWTYWTLGEWDAVVRHWEHTARVKPDWPELSRYLPTAKEHRDADLRLAATRTDAPLTVRAPLPSGSTLRLRAVGDIMLGTDFPAGYLAPDDGAHLLDGVKGLLADADLTFGNLEGPLCDGGETYKCGENATACYAFRSPTRYGAYLKDAGLDMLSIANNHAGDFGAECREQTKATLDKLGLAWSGTVGSVGTVQVGDKKIGLVAFHTSSEVNDVNDPERAALLVRDAKRNHDYVLVSFHGGAEGSKALHVPRGRETFYNEDRGDLRAFARVVVDAGADLVLGHGPHVTRGMEVIDGHLVAYSLGNFATYGRFNLDGNLGTTLVLEVVLDAQGKLVSGRILPVRLEGKGVPMPDPDAKSIDLIRELSRVDFGDLAPVFGQDGTFAPKP